MTPSTPPGWYPALGDPPGTERYWDGQAWQGFPQAVPAPMGFNSAGVVYPEPSNAITALVCSISGFVFCGLPFPIGWSLASTELEAIDQGRRDPSNRDTARAARIIGIIGTLLMALMILLIAAAFIAAAVAAA